MLLKADFFFEVVDEKPSKFHLSYKRSTGVFFLRSTGELLLRTGLSDGIIVSDP
jgi:hypothetical protein